MDRAIYKYLFIIFFIIIIFKLNLYILLVFNKFKIQKGIKEIE